MNVKNAGVKVDGNRVELRVSYCIPNVESDSNTFSELIGGRHDTTKEQAIAAVIDSAKSWANNLRAEGHSVAVWDEVGNHY